MFKSLALRTRILALPAVAAIGFVLTLAVTVGFGRHARDKRRRVRIGDDDRRGRRWERRHLEFDDRGGCAGGQVSVDENAEQQKS